MNAFRYAQKKRALVRGIVRRVNNCLRAGSPSTRAGASFKNEQQGESYSLIVYKDGGWQLFVLSTQVVLQVEYRNNRVILRGISSRRRITYIDTTPNQHIFGAVDRLLATP